MINFEIVFKVGGIVIALLLPILPGCLAIDSLLPAMKKRMVLYVVFALVVGHALLSSLTYILWIAGFKITLPLYLSILTVTFLIFRALKSHLSRNESKYAPKRDGLVCGTNDATPKSHRSVFMFLVAVSVIYFIIVAITTFSESVSDWPGVGIYGLKGKIIHHTGSCIDIFTNKEIAYGHPEYPLGYALMITWCCSLGGGFDDALIKIIPFFWGIIAFSTIYQVGKYISGRKNMTLLFALFTATTTTYLNCCIKMYTEMILLTCVVSGFYCLTRFFDVESEEYSACQDSNGKGRSDTNGHGNLTVYPPSPPQLRGYGGHGRRDSIKSFNTEETKVRKVKTTNSYTIESSTEYRTIPRISRKTSWLLSGFIFLIISCWYKMEGYLYLFSAALGVAIFAFKDLREVLASNRKTIAYILLIASLLFLLPWSLTKFQYGLHARDFSLTGCAFASLKLFSPKWNEIILEISDKFRHEYLVNKYNIGICCSFMLLSMLLLIRKNFYKPAVIRKHFRRNRRTYFVLFCPLTVIFLLYISFFASIMPLWWHLQAVKRVLLIPNALICLALFSATKRQD